MSVFRGGKVPVVDSEFADVSVEAIIWLPEGHLTRLLDPSADRWRDA